MGFHKSFSHFSVYFEEISSTLPLSIYLLSFPSPLVWASSSAAYLFTSQLAHSLYHGSIPPSQIHPHPRPRCLRPLNRIRPLPPAPPSTPRASSAPTTTTPHTRLSPKQHRRSGGNKARTISAAKTDTLKADWC